VLDIVMNRVFGNPKSFLDVTTGGKTLTHGIDISLLDDRDLRKIIATYEKAKVDES